MNNDELLLRKELATSKEWGAIRTRILDYCSEQSGSDMFCERYSRGFLYAIKFVDEWVTSYDQAVKKAHRMKGED